MEAFDRHQNAIKVPEVKADVLSSVMDHPRPTHSPLHPISFANHGDSVVSTDAGKTKESIHISQPSHGEYVEQHVVTVKPPHSEVHTTPDLLHDEEITSEEEGDLEHTSSEHKVGKVKKMKNKLGNAFRKVFHKKDHHDEHEGTPHSTQESGNPDDHTNTTKLEKETTTSSHDYKVQKNLETAFATEGLKAAKDLTGPTMTQNRYEIPITGEFIALAQKTGQPMDLGKMTDIMDHKSPTRSPVESTHEITSVEKREGTMASEPQKRESGESVVVREEIREAGYYSASAVDSKQGTGQSGASVKRDNHGSAERIRHTPESDPILRDLDLSQLAPLRRDSGHRIPHHPHITAHYSPEVSQESIPKFENVPVRAHVGAETGGHLIRSSEEWNINEPHEKPLVKAPLLVGDLVQEAQKFSQKFETVGSHHHRSHSSEENPQLVDIMTYQDRLSQAREKWVAPVEALHSQRTEAADHHENLGLETVRSFERVASDVGVPGHGVGSTGVIREGAGYMLPEHTRLQERVLLHSNRGPPEFHSEPFETERVSVERSSFQDAPPGKPFRTDISNEGGSYGLRQGIDSRVDDRNFSDNRGSRAPPDNRQFMNRDNYNTYGGPPSGGLPGNQFSGNQAWNESNRSATDSIGSQIRHIDSASSVGGSGVGLKYPAGGNLDNRAGSVGNVVPPPVNLDRSNKLMDAELRGQDLERHSRVVVSTSTIPQSFDQPILESLSGPPKPYVHHIPPAEIGKLAENILRETDTKATELLDGETYASASIKEAKDISAEHAAEENSHKSVVTKVVESVESTVAGLATSVAELFTGHKVEPLEGSPDEKDYFAPETEKTQKTEAVSEVDAHESQKGVMEKVMDKVWGVFGSGPAATDLPSEEHKTVVEEKTEKIVEVKSELVVPLAVSGEFVSGSLGGASGASGGIAGNRSDIRH